MLTTMLYQIINAFLHPQKETYAFQLSEKRLYHFADLGIAGDAARSAGAETVLPFAEESDARTEFTFAMPEGHHSVSPRIFMISSPYRTSQRYPAALSRKVTQGLRRPYSPNRLSGIHLRQWTVLPSRRKMIHPQRAL